MKANFYLNNQLIATIDNISYETPWLTGRHHFFDKNLLAKLVAITEYERLMYINRDLPKEERENQFNALKQKTGLSDSDLEEAWESDWQIILDVDNYKPDGCPKIDNEWIEWR